jgi:hypothetical protein
MKKENQNIQKNENDKSRKWKLRKGNVLVVEDAETASLVIVARELKDLNDKIKALKEVLGKFEAQVVHP